MESGSPTSGVDEPVEIVETDVRETALLDSFTALEEDSMSKIAHSISTSNNITLSERSFVNGGKLSSDHDIHIENEVFTDGEIKETDLTDPFTIDNFDAKFIDIDTSFSDDELQESVTNSSMTDGRQSTDNFYENDDRRSSSQSSNTTNLLKATISELERALSDTKRLLFVRDEENSKLRIHNTKLQQDLDREKNKVEQLKARLAEDEFNETTFDAGNNSSDIVVESQVKKGQALKETIKYLEGSFPNKDYGVTGPKNGQTINGTYSSHSNGSVVSYSSRKHSGSLSSQNSVEDMQNKITDQEREISKLRDQLANQVGGGKSQCQKQIQLREKVSKLCDRDINTQLRLKFLRDAFFYYMIDFHADEQIKAILAILEYEDKRQDIIFESHKMRQMGKRFTVTKVSSRCLTFVQEEIR